ncbi:MAG TPA: hypothetical protein EYO33_06025 [Phycisphaerales bacterium]|nr:hypothetical protein [Phycisphaerales bacterium]
MDSVLTEAEYLLKMRDYQAAVDCIRAADPSQDREVQALRRRFLAWATLATGETTQAYELFWSCAHHEGARAGILLLTVLAGQVETAVTNWRRYCDKLPHPPLSLPDKEWHTPAVVRPALMILENYPFPERSTDKGAAAVYQALLHQTQGNASETFRTLGRVTDYYLPAQLLRDKWMDGLLCLPLPKNSPETAAESSRPQERSTTSLRGHRAEDVVAKAVQILLYPDIELLQGQCETALQEGRYLEALEALRRMLFLDPQHTPSLEKRWRLYLMLEEPDAAKADLFYLMDLYEREKQILACQRVAAQTLDLFPEDERALLKMCFLQARLDCPTELALYGRKLLALCRKNDLHERANSYRRWLLRQSLSLDDRTDFEVG